MSRPNILFKIDVTRIDKDRLYASEKTGAKYLEGIIIFTGKKDQYGNEAIVVESVSKAERDQGVQGTILGNAKEQRGR